MIKSKSSNSAKLNSIENNVNGQRLTNEQIMESFEEKHQILIDKQKEYLDLYNNVRLDQIEIKRDLLENIGLHRVDESTIEEIAKGQIIKVAKIESFTVSGVYLIKQDHYLGLKQINYYDQSAAAYECETKHGKERILKSEVIGLFEILQ